MWSSTTMPRSTSRPADLARPVPGRMPTAMTTRSAGISRPSSSRTPVTWLSPRISLVSAPVRTLMPRRLELALEQQARRFVELALHQGRHQVDHGHVHAVDGQPVGRFQPEQAAADDDGVLAAVGGLLQHRFDVEHVAEGHDAGQVAAGDRDDEGVGAGREQQPVVFDGAAATARSPCGLRGRSSRPARR